MNLTSESDRAPLDEWHRQLPLSEDELRRLRKLLVDEDRATWLRKQLKVIVPAMVFVLSTCYALGVWIASHFSWKP